MHESQYECKIRAFSCAKQFATQIMRLLCNAVERHRRTDKDCSQKDDVEANLSILQSSLL